MPNASCSSLTTGAAQCAVQEPLETMRSPGTRWSSLMPMTTVRSGGSSGGTQSTTRRAPRSRCLSISARVRGRPVASTTMSTPCAPQSALSAKIGIWRP